MPTAPPTTQPQRLGLFTAGMLLPGSAYAHGIDALAGPLLLIVATCIIPAADLLRRGAWRLLFFYVLGLPFIWVSSFVMGYLTLLAMQLLAWLLHTMGLPYASDESLSLIGAVSLGVLLIVVLPFIYWRRLLRPYRLQRAAAKGVSL